MSCRNREREREEVAERTEPRDFLKRSLFLQNALDVSSSPSNVQSFGFFIQDFLPRLATLTVLAVLETLANEFRLTEC